MTRDCDGVSPRFESHTGRIAKTLKNENFAVFFNLLSLVDFHQSHMLGDSININNLCCNPV